MPLYTFECNKCEKVFEELRSYNNRDKYKPCPECKTGSELWRLIDLTHLEFKGGGWSKDGYSK